MSDLDFARLAGMLTCKCGHGTSAHDEGWGYTGCLSGACPCRKFEGEVKAGDADEGG